MNLAVPQHDPPTFNGADRPPADRRVEFAHRRRRDASGLRRFNDGQRQGMLAGPLDAGRQAQNFGLVESGRRHDRRHRRLALGERAGLVHDEGVDAAPCAPALRRS